MKTTKFFSILSLALIFVGVTTGFSQKEATFSSTTLPDKSITYQVIIHSDFVKPPCNTYVIQILDETGHLVAPAEAFTPGISTYVIKEKVSAVGIMHSSRVAVLVPVKFPNHYTCVFPLFTLPDVLRGPFFAGQTYTFNLYPKTQSETID